MKRIGLLVTVIAFCGLGVAAQDTAERGHFYQTFSSRTPGLASTSQVSSFSVGNTVWFAAYSGSFDNLTNVLPYDSRAGATNAITFTYNSGPEVRGYFTSNGFTMSNYRFGNADNAEASTQMTVVIAPHAIPKLRGRNNVATVAVTFTATGRVALFGEVGPGVSPLLTRTFSGHGTGYINYTRLTSQYYTMVYRQIPNPQLIASSISLDFVTP